MDIHPIFTKVRGVRFTHYICSFRDKNRSILILHYTNLDSVKYLLNN